jgi:hypothetical protein
MESTEIQKRAKARKAYVEQAIAQARTIAGAEVRVCGISGFALVDPDICFEQIRDKPLWLIYESLNHMARFIDEYDYFVNMEDDIFLPEDTFNNIIEFDKESIINEILLPNRLERNRDGNYCVDLSVMPGWAQQRKRFKGNDIRVALNPHSALTVLSKEKFKYALSHIDREFRKSILYNELDSAFAYFHSPFSLYRSENMNFHYVIHLDKWSYSPGEEHYYSSTKNRLLRIKMTDFVPPLLYRLYKFVTARILGCFRA